MTLTAAAQYNREYFFWVGRKCMMNKDYQEAIRTLNILLRADPEAYEGYFWRGIAKYQLNDPMPTSPSPSKRIPSSPRPTPTGPSPARGWATTTTPCAISRRPST